MKKIFLGLLQTILTPLIIFTGNYLFFKLPWMTDEARNFAFVLGAITVVINWFIGILLIIRGYQETKTFDGW